MSVVGLSRLGLRRRKWRTADVSSSERGRRKRDLRIAGEFHLKRARAVRREPSRKLFRKAALLRSCGLSEMPVAARSFSFAGARNAFASASRRSPRWMTGFPMIERHHRASTCFDCFAPSHESRTRTRGIVVSTSTKRHAHEKCASFDKDFVQKKNSKSTTRGNLQGACKLRFGEEVDKFQRGQQHGTYLPFHAHRPTCKFGPDEKSAVTI